MNKEPSKIERWFLVIFIGAVTVFLIIGIFTMAKSLPGTEVQFTNHSIRINTISDGFNKHMEKYHKSWYTRVKEGLEKTSFSN